MITLISSHAQASGHEPAILLAVIDVESGGRVFARVDGRNEPLIRFEGHYFDRRLSGAKRLRARKSGLAHPSAGRVANPPSQTARWTLLRRAIEIDRAAALESCSWGVGQVMGAHWRALGFDSVEAMVEHCRSGLEGQVDIMLRFIAHAGLGAAMARRDWHAFARGYNGPAYARHGYHSRLARAWERYRQLAFANPTATERTRPADGRQALTRGARGEAVADLQTWLTAAGYPLSADSAFGPLTEAALRAFQKDHELPPSGTADDATLAALGRVLPIRRFWRGLVAWLARRIAPKRNS